MFFPIFVTSIFFKKGCELTFKVFFLDFVFISIYSLLAMNLVLVLADIIFVFDLHKLHRYIEKFVSLSTSQFKLQVNYKLHFMRDHLARY